MLPKDGGRYLAARITVNATIVHVEGARNVPARRLESFAMGIVFQKAR